MPSLLTVVGFDPYHFAECLKSEPSPISHSCISFYNSFIALTQLHNLQRCLSPLLLKKSKVLEVAKMLEESTSRFLQPLSNHKAAMKYSLDLFGSYFFSVLLVEKLKDLASNSFLKFVLCDLEHDEIQDKGYVYNLDSVEIYTAILPQRSSLILNHSVDGKSTAHNSCFTNGDCEGIFRIVAGHEDWDLNLVQVRTDWNIKNSQHLPFLNKNISEFIKTHIVKNVEQKPEIVISSYFSDFERHKSYNFMYPTSLQFSVVKVIEDNSNQKTIMVKLDASEGFLSITKVGGNSFYVPIERQKQAMLLAKEYCPYVCTEFVGEISLDGYSQIVKLGKEHVFMPILVTRIPLAPNISPETIPKNLLPENAKFCFFYQLLEFVADLKSKNAVHETLTPAKTFLSTAHRYIPVGARNIKCNRLIVGDTGALNSIEGDLFEAHPGLDEIEISRETRNSYPELFFCKYVEWLHLKDTLDISIKYPYNPFKESFLSNEKEELEELDEYLEAEIQKMYSKLVSNKCARHLQANGTFSRLKNRHLSKYVLQETYWYA
jgi:hypothetical protein